jgi:hypothetical protein
MSQVVSMMKSSAVCFIAVLLISVPGIQPLRTTVDTPGNDTRATIKATHPVNTTGNVIPTDSNTTPDNNLQGQTTPSLPDPVLPRMPAFTTMHTDDGAVLMTVSDASYMKKCNLTLTIDDVTKLLVEIKQYQSENEDIIYFYFEN